MTKEIWIITVLSIMSKYVVSDLKGPNVCQEEERYEVNVTKYILRNVTVRSYQWCLQVPPRCSTYNVHLMNDTKIEEEIKTRSINKCCDGFYETNEETCLPELCRLCVHGQCDENGVCSCEPGFWGSMCDQECTPDKWKNKCQQDCTNCTEGHCNINSSNCTVCPPKFIRCDLICSEGHKYNEECLKDCGCNNISACNLLSNECRTIEKDNNTTTMENNELFNSTLRRNDFKDENKHRNIINLPQITTESLGDIQNNNLNYTITESYSENVKSTNFITVTTEIIEKESIYQTKFFDTTTTSDNITDVTDDVFTQKNINFMLKSSEKHKVNNNISDSDQYIRVDSIPFDNKTKEKHALQSSNHTSHNLVIDNHLFATIVSAGLFSALTIICAAVFCVLYKLKVKKKKYIQAARNSVDNGKEDLKLKESGPSLSVTTRSIFHTPLPEPPTFENPAFLTQAEGIQTKQSGILETHIICNVNIPKITQNDQHKQDIPDFFYDHPSPSTGKFRTALQAEAPNSNCAKINFDPIYDEIPCHQRIVPVLSPSSTSKQEQSILYMNI